MSNFSTKLAAEHPCTAIQGDQLEPLAEKSCAFRFLFEVIQVRCEELKYVHNLADHVQTSRNILVCVNLPRSAYSPVARGVSEDVAEPRFAFMGRLDLMPKVASSHTDCFVWAHH